MARWWLLIALTAATAMAGDDDAIRERPESPGFVSGEVAVSDVAYGLRRGSERSAFVANGGDGSLVVWTTDAEPIVGKAARLSASGELLDPLPRRLPLPPNGVTWDGTRYLIAGGSAVVTMSVSGETAPFATTAGYATGIAADETNVAVIEIADDHSHTPYVERFTRDGVLQQRLPLASSSLCIAANGSAFLIVGSAGAALLADGALRSVSLPPFDRAAAAWEGGRWAIVGSSARGVERLTITADGAASPPVHIEDAVAYGGVGIAASGGSELIVVGRNAKVFAIADGNAPAEVPMAVAGWPAVAATPDGFVLVWNGGADAFGSDVFSLALPRGPVLQPLAPRLVSRAARSQRAPVVFSRGRHAARVVWSELESDGTCCDVRLSDVDRNGTRVHDGVTIATAVPRFAAADNPLGTMILWSSSFSTIDGVIVDADAHVSKRFGTLHVPNATIAGVGCTTGECVVGYFVPFDGCSGPPPSGVQRLSFDGTPLGSPITAYSVVDGVAGGPRDVVLIRHSFDTCRTDFGGVILRDGQLRNEFEYGRSTGAFAAANAAEWMIAIDPMGPYSDEALHAAWLTADSRILGEAGIVAEDFRPSAAVWDGRHWIVALQSRLRGTRVLRFNAAHTLLDPPAGTAIDETKDDELVTSIAGAGRARSVFAIQRTTTSETQYGGAPRVFLRWVDSEWPLAGR